MSGVEPHPFLLVPHTLRIVIGLPYVKVGFLVINLVTFKRVMVRSTLEYPVLSNIYFSVVNETGRPVTVHTYKLE